MKKIGFVSGNYIKYAWKLASKNTAIYIVFRVFFAFIPTLQIIVMGSFLNHAQKAFTMGSVTKGLKQSIIILFLFILTQYFVSILVDYTRWKFRLCTGVKYDLILTEKRSRLKYSLTENPDILDLIQKITEESSERIGKGTDNVLTICDYIIRISGIVITICKSSKVVGIIVLLLFCIMIPVAKKCGEEDYEAFTEVSKKYRRAAYLRKVLAHRDFVEERKLFDYTNPINKKWEEQQKEARELSQKVMKKNFFHIRFAGSMTILLAIVIAAVLIFPLVRGTMSTGIYISIVSTVLNLTKMMSWEVAGIIEDYIVNRKYMQDVLYFLSLEEIEETVCNDKKAKIETVRFEKVSFRYPGTDCLILKEVSFLMKKGKVYALVGENGAGKSTIIKLLLGLYDDYEGDIYINDSNIRNMDISERNSYFSVAYQNFAKYELSFKENLLLAREKKEITDREIQDCINTVGLNECVERLSQGLDSDLGRLEGKGSDLSGGEWQRIAIGRMLLRKSPIRIMDEPTAALDPIHEKEIYDMLSERENDVVKIMVTHRLGGIQKADCIFVFENGKLVEQGSHELLMNADRLYAKMYKTQRKWYI